MQHLPPKCRVEGKNVSQNSNTHYCPQGSGLWQRESTRKRVSVKWHKSFVKATRMSRRPKTKPQGEKGREWGADSHRVMCCGSQSRWAELSWWPHLRPHPPSPRLQEGEAGLRAIHQPGAETPPLSEIQSLRRIPARCVSIRQLRCHNSLTWRWRWTYHILECNKTTLPLLALYTTVKYSLLDT